MPTRRSQQAGSGPASPSQDPVIRLCVNYFFVCRELREQLARAKDAYEAADSNELRDQIYRDSFGVYIRLWLASLFPVCEGFRKLELKDSEIDMGIRQCMAALRAVAKNVGAYQEDEAFKAGTGRFLTRGDVDMNSAEQLFLGFERFFTDYLAAAGVLTGERRMLN